MYMGIAGVAAALLEQTDRLKFLVAFRPGLVPPTLAAQPAVTPAAVKFLNREVATLRVPLSGMTPDERARRALQDLPSD